MFEEVQTGTGQLLSVAQTVLAAVQTENGQVLSIAQTVMAAVQTENGQVLSVAQTVTVTAGSYRKGWTLICCTVPTIPAAAQTKTSQMSSTNCFSSLTNL